MPTKPTRPDRTPEPASAIVPGRISIIIPTWNSEEFLASALDSLIAQGIEDLEIVIHDGGSTDGTKDIIDSYRPELHIVAHSAHDDGQSDALNRALSATSGDTIGWLNSDDEYAPGSLRELRDRLQMDNSVLIAYGDHEHIDPSGRPLAWYPALPPWAWLMRHEGFVFNAQSALWRREVHRICGDFDERLSRTMDYDFILRLLDTFRPASFAQVPITVGRFRRHEAQKTRGSDAIVQREHVYIQEKYGRASARNSPMLRPYWTMARAVRLATYFRRGGARYVKLRLQAG